MVAIQFLGISHSDSLQSFYASISKVSNEGKASCKRFPIFGISENFLFITLTLTK